MTFPAKWVQPANWFSMGFINQNRANSLPRILYNLIEAEIVLDGEVVGLERNLAPVIEQNIAYLKPV